MDAHWSGPLKLQSTQGKMGLEEEVIWVICMAEAQKPGWQGGESFCASGKFLRVTLEIALGSFRMVWKVSG